MATCMTEFISQPAAPQFYGRVTSELLSEWKLALSIFQYFKISFWIAKSGIEIIWVCWWFFEAFLVCLYRFAFVIAFFVNLVFDFFMLVLCGLFVYFVGVCFSPSPLIFWLKRVLFHGIPCDALIYFTGCFCSFVSNCIVNITAKESSH